MPPKSSYPHGHYLRYGAGCRCDLCRRANRERAAADLERRKETPFEAIPHGVKGYNHYGCRCDRCRKANSERVANEAARRSSSRDIPHGVDGFNNYNCRCDICREGKRAESADYIRRAQAESLPGAKKRGQEWTGPELELAARKDLTAKQVAAMVGRTVSGVRNVRSRFSKEPQLRALAGISDPED